MTEESDETGIRCPHEKAAARDSICRPAHRCEKTEGHAGKHVCDCGVTFARSTNLGD